MAHVDILWRYTWLLVGHTQRNGCESVLRVWVILEQGDEPPPGLQDTVDMYEQELAPLALLLVLLMLRCMRLGTPPAIAAALAKSMDIIELS